MAELPLFADPLQSAREEARRRAFERVQQLTRQGRHLEAHQIWEREVSATGTHG